MTGLPIIETKAGDVSAYIPTNVISITDGQIYLQSDLFNANVRPAIDVGVSVSRVGGAAQIKAMKSVAGRLKLDLAQYRALEAFAMFASDLDPASRAQLAKGARLVELLKQRQASPSPVEEQVVSIWMGTTGKLDDVAVEDVRRFEADFLDHLRRSKNELLAAIRETGKFEEETEQALESEVATFKHQALPGHRRRRHPGRRRGRGRRGRQGAGVRAGEDRQAEALTRQAGCRAPAAGPARATSSRTRKAETYGSADPGVPEPHPCRQLDEEDHPGDGAHGRLPRRQGAAGGA